MPPVEWKPFFLFVINVYSEATTKFTCRLHMLRLANSRNTLGFGIQFDNRIDVHSSDLCTRTALWFYVIVKSGMCCVSFMYYFMHFLLVLLRDVFVRHTTTENRFKLIYSMNLLLINIYFSVIVLCVVILLLFLLRFHNSCLNNCTSELRKTETSFPYKFYVRNLWGIINPKDAHGDFRIFYVIKSKSV